MREHIRSVLLIRKFSFLWLRPVLKIFLISIEGNIGNASSQDIRFKKLTVFVIVLLIFYLLFFLFSMDFKTAVIKLFYIKGQEQKKKNTLNEVCTNSNKNHTKPTK